MNMAQVALAVRIASAVDLVCTVIYLVNSVVRWWTDLSEEVRSVTNVFQVPRAAHS